MRFAQVEISAISDIATPIQVKKNFKFQAFRQLFAFKSSDRRISAYAVDEFDELKYQSTQTAKVEALESWQILFESSSESNYRLKSVECVP